jgi:hypothetical protein
MQIIYVAPFILLSVLSFVVCLAIPKLRRISLPALVAPVAFGVCSIVGWISFVLVSDFVLKISLGPASGFHGVMEGLAFYLLPGVLGAWFAMWLVRVVERYINRIPMARKIILASAVSAVCAGIGGLVGLALASRLLPLGSEFETFGIAVGASAFLAVGGFAAAMILQSRHQDAPAKTS